MTTCHGCGHECKGDAHTTGYGIDDKGNKFCYDCCAARELKSMRDTGRATLYLTGNKTDGYKITDWPGKLVFKVYSIKFSRAAAYGRSIERRDAWFILDGWFWHCVSKGDMDLARCKRTKEKWVAYPSGGGYHAVRTNPGRGGLLDLSVTRNRDGSYLVAAMINGYREKLLVYGNKRDAIAAFRKMYKV